TRVDDSAGTGYHLTAANFDSTSFVEGNFQSLFNKWGYYNDGGTYIAPDMATWDGSAPVDDVDGNTLVYKGQAQYPMVARDASSFTGDGVAYFTITGLLTTDVITALSTDLPTCTINGRLDIAATDEVWGVTVTRAGSLWAYYPICEGQGNSIYDVSGNGRHGVGTNVANNNWTVQDLPDEDYLAEFGVTVVEYLGTTRLVPFLNTKVSQYSSVAPVINAGETYTDYPQGGKNLIPQTYVSMPENIWELYIADQQTRWEELTSGDVVIGEEYLIIQHSIVDFISVGAADNDVGTIFTATSTGITLSDVDILGLKTTQTGNKVEIDAILNDLTADVTVLTVDTIHFTADMVGGAAGEIYVYSAQVHQLITDDEVVISGTTDYNGQYSVTVVNDYVFSIACHIINNFSDGQSESFSEDFLLTSEPEDKILSYFNYKFK
ncbi:hypothetical protein LCGC14_2698140, partial [marine sediment metagenome]